MIRNLAILCLCTIGLTACGLGSYRQVKPTLTAEEAVYHLNSGDMIKVTVFDEPELSNKFSVDSQGMVALPLIGKTSIIGQTEQQAAQTIADKLRKNGFLKNPKVSVETASMRSFFIIGEVEHGGKFPFQNGLTVYQAVAIAGGYTYRADRDDITIRRQTSKGAGTEQTFSAKENSPVLPGDAIEIGERFL